MASWPLAASPATSNPSCCRISRTACRTISWSSARRMRVGILTRVLLAQEREEIRKAPQIGPGKSLTAWPSEYRGAPRLRRGAPERWGGWGAMSGPRISSAGPSGLDQATADGVADEPGGLVDAGLFHDPCPVGLRGLEADPQELGDLLRRLALGDELQHFSLAGCQRVHGQLRLGPVPPADRLRDP